MIQFSGGDEMTQKIKLLLVLAVVCVSSAESAEIVEVPLPSLVGTYDFPAHVSRSADFVLDRIPTQVYRVSVRLSGVTVTGSAICVGIDAFPYCSRIMTSMKDPINLATWSKYQLMPDHFCEISMDLELEKTEESPATWDFLQQGFGSVSVGITAYVLLPGCIVIDYPVETISEATLLIEADWILAAEGDTWGAIKSLVTPSRR